MSRRFPPPPIVAAMAPPPGRGGIGIVRISGSATRRIAEGLLGKLPGPRHASFAHFLDASSQPIDQGLAIKQTKRGQKGYSILNPYKTVPKAKWLASDSRIIAMLKQILGDKICDHNDSGATVGLVSKTWHKDNRHDKKDEVKEYKLDWNPDFKVVRIGLYLTDNKKHSGALAVKAGSHKVQNLKDGKIVVVENNPGDLVIFDVRITHCGNFPVLRPIFKWIPLTWLRPYDYWYRDYNPLITKIPRKIKYFLNDLLVKLPIFYPFDKNRMAIMNGYGVDNWQSKRWKNYMVTVSRRWSNNSMMHPKNLDNTVTPIK